MCLTTISRAPIDQGGRFDDGMGFMDPAPEIHSPYREL